MINGKKVSNFGKKRGLVSMQDVLSQSLNVGAAHVQSLWVTNGLPYMFSYGMDERTGYRASNDERLIKESTWKC
jgi:hypothetical protein